MTQKTTTRLAIVSTHPIQYYAPVFQSLALREGMQVKVFYGWKGATEKAKDHGFGKLFQWDIPLLDGYDHEFVSNVAHEPGTHHFRGIDSPDLNERICTWRPDVLLVYGWSYKAHLAAMRYFHGRVPVLFRGDSTLLDEQPGWKLWARRRWLRWVYRHVDIGLYVGAENRRYFEAHGLRSDQLVFAPHAVDNHRFANSSDDEWKAREWRERLKINDNETVILFAGKLEPKKAPDMLLRAFNVVSDRHTHLIFAGTGPLERELKAAANERVHFIGFQNQSHMPAVYRLGDVLILPSAGPGETWGLALNEAMACGRAVAATTRVGAACDLIEANRNGWILRAGDQSAMGDFFRCVSSIDRSSLLAMGQESRQIISQWTISQQVDGIVNAIDLRVPMHPQDSRRRS